MSPIPMVYCGYFIEMNENHPSFKFITQKLIIMLKPMESLTSKMRELAIENLKNRREEIFNRTRKLMELHQSDEDSHDSHAELKEERGERKESGKRQEKEGEMQIQTMMEEDYKPKGKAKRKKQKHTSNDYKTKRYWRRMLQVSDYLVSIPSNFNDFYIGIRSQGNKCLMVMTHSSIEICDKAGNLVVQFPSNSKAYNGTILEVYLDEEKKIVVVSDMIIWKGNPMTGSEFEFRVAWLQSNLNLVLLNKESKYRLQFMRFFICSVQNLKQAYLGDCPYFKDGLLFVHKDSAYEHGLNPNVLIWKDDRISAYFSAERDQNKLMSRGVGYINKEGEVRSVENVTLFILDRTKFDPQHKFAKFTYRSLHLTNINEETVKVQLQELVLTQTTRNHYGPVDSLGKLFYKSCLKYGLIKFEQLMYAASQQMLIQ